MFNRKVNASNSNENMRKSSVDKKIRNILKKRFDTREKNLKALSHEKLFNRLVNEAVIAINASWLADAEYSKLPCGSTVPIEAYCIFFITTDFKVYSDSVWSSRINPKTGRCCFNDCLTLNSEEEVQKYIDAIMNILPSGTECKPFEADMPSFGKCKCYSFSLTIQLDSSSEANS